MVLDELREIADRLRRTLGDLEPERLSGPDAAHLLDAFSDLEKLASGGKLLAARRVESSNVWRRRGHRSAAAHIAEATGTGLGPAITTLEAARRLGSLPITDGALRDGRLSETQVKEIAGAAILRPESERALVDAARTQPVNTLKLRCRRIKATGQDQQAVYEAIRRRRYLRNWIDGEGAVRFDARLTPDDGARLIAAIKDRTDRLAREAKQAGSDEPLAALRADALVALACRVGTPAVDPARRGSTAARPTSPGGATHGPTTMVHVRVDHSALVRGRVSAGEVCEIPGVGPIPVEVARRLAADSILSVLVTDGVDVTTVAHAGRTIPANLRRALVERDPHCVIPGCTVRDDLEIDHVHRFAEGGLTDLSNLVRLCHWHHYLKTHHGHRLERADKGWRWVVPDTRQRAPSDPAD